jgi:cell wall-associated NlpC family hydrolase
MMLSRREAIIVAESWVGTPYAMGARVRGGGCDCGTLLAEYLIGIGRCTREEMDAKIASLGPFSHDWFCHAESERYENALLAFAPLRWQGVCAGTPPAKPGDIAMYRVAGSKRFNHGSIILTWPRAVHAFTQRVALARPTLHPLTSHQAMAIFDPWAQFLSDQGAAAGLDLVNPLSGCGCLKTERA